MPGFKDTLLFGFFQEGRTESIKNELDPRFVRAFTLDYYFETVQKVKVAVYDMDNSTDSLKDDDFLGQVECTLGQVCGCSACRLNDRCHFGHCLMIIRNMIRNMLNEVS